MARRCWPAFGVLMALAAATPTEAAVKRADLAPTKAGTASRQASPGDVVRISWTLKNRGRRAAPASATRLFLSTNAKLDKKDIRLGAAKERALRPRKSIKRSLRVVIPAKAAPASYRLLVCADAASKVRESNERNNCRATATLRVVARASVQPAPLPAPAPDPAPAPVPTSVPSPALSVAITAPGADAAVRAGSSVTLRVTSTRGLRSLDVRLRGERVGQTKEADVTGEVTRTIDIDVAAASNGAAALEATATDAAGVRADAEPIPVVVDNDLPPETGPSTALILEEPVGLTELATTLAASGVRVVEYFSERRLPSGETLTGGFYGRGLTLGDQIATYLAVHERKAPGEEPEVYGLRVEGDAEPAELGALGALVEDAEPVEPGEPYSAARARLDGARVGRGDRAAADEDDDPPWPWWPSFGELDTEEYSTVKGCMLSLVCMLFDPPVPVNRVTFTHTLVWAGTALFNPNGVPIKAYEHDFKIERTRPTVGVRPFCVGDGRFYASRKGGVEWETTVPALAAPYLDLDLVDSCSTADLTVGIGFPVYAARHHLDPLPTNGPGGVWWTTGHRITIDAQRDAARGAFLLRAQSLDNVNCSYLVTSWCVGLDTSKTEQRTILSSGDKLLPGVELPVCVAWIWPPSFDEKTPTRMARCVGDRDRDGWDDGIDCGPDTPSRHPGALEYVDDGIDQDCDGEDVRTIGHR